VSYDHDLAERLREALAGERGVTEKRMFGGLAFLVGGNLAVSASGRGGLMVRVDPAETDELIADPVADRFIMRGREMDGWLHVRLTAEADDAELGRWVAKGVAYARSLPAKKEKA
jgi:TfoX-like protein